jgi:hypothetical protein
VSNGIRVPRLGGIPMPATSGNPDDGSNSPTTAPDDNSIGSVAVAPP